MSERPWYAVLAEGVAGPSGGWYAVWGEPAPQRICWSIQRDPTSWSGEKERRQRAMQMAQEMLRDWPSWALPRS